MTPVKYEHDIQQVTGALTIVKNQENNGTQKIGLVTPTPDDKMASMQTVLKLITLVQDCDIPNALPMEIHVHAPQSCPKPL